MIAALIDNGSLEPAAHLSLRRAAAALSSRAGVEVAAVSWRHSDRIPAEELGGEPAWTLPSWIRAKLGAGARDFVFVPYFVSAGGAIATALRTDLRRLLGGPAGFTVAGGLSSASLAAILADRVRDVARSRRLARPPVVVVDHGGPSAESGALRDAAAAALQSGLGGNAGPVFAASMESPGGPEFAFNLPLFADLLAGPGLAGDIVIAPLFMSPGRHAGPGGDLERIARAAEAARPSLRCHFAGLAGTHPIAIDALARGLSATLP